MAINFVKEDDVSTLRDIEQFYGTVWNFFTLPPHFFVLNNTRYDDYCLLLSAGYYSLSIHLLLYPAFSLIDN